MRLLQFVLRFLGLQYKESFLRSFIIQLTITLIALETCEKECNMLEIILVRGFCPLKIKTTQFPDEFHFKYNEVQSSPSSMLISNQSFLGK